MSPPGTGQHFGWSVQPVGDEVIVVLKVCDHVTGGAPVQLTVSLGPYEAAAIGRTLINAAVSAYQVVPQRRGRT